MLCSHKRGDYLHGLWVCADCFNVLQERPYRYAMRPWPAPTGEPGKTRQEIVWQADFAESSDRVKLSKFLAWMISYMRLRSAWTVSKDEARQQCLEVLRDQGDPFGSSDAGWEKDDAKELVREGICAYWDEAPAGANT